MIAKFYGLQVGPQIAEVSFQSIRDGTTAAFLAHEARRLGLNVQGLNVSPESLSKLPYPFIAHIRPVHFVVVEGISKGRVFLADPAKGYSDMLLTHFGNIFTGLVLTFAPNRRMEGAVEDCIPRCDKDGPSRGGNLRHRVSLKGVIIISQYVAYLAVPIFLVALSPRRASLHATRPSIVVAIGCAFVGLLYLIYVARAWLRNSASDLAVGVLTRAIPAAAWCDVADDLKHFALQYRKARDAQLVSVDIITLLCIAGTLLGIMLYMSPLVWLAAAGGTCICAAFGYIATRRSPPSFQNLFSYACLNVTSLDREGTMEGSQTPHELHTLCTRDCAASSTYDALQIVRRAVAGLIGTCVIYAMWRRISVGSLSALWAVAFAYISGSMLTFSSEIASTCCSTLDPSTAASGSGQMLECGACVDDYGMPQCECTSKVLRVADVGFRHSESSMWTLRHVSIVVAPGDLVVIRGPSGTGKTTLLKLLAGIYKPTEGGIWYGATEVRSFAICDSRCGIGFACQGILPLGTSIETAIAGSSDVHIRRRVNDAARLACIYDVIQRMPLRFNTPFANAQHMFSTGELQRIQIASAVAHGTQVLLLDDLASSLEKELESTIYENVIGLRCTRIVVSNHCKLASCANYVLELASKC